MSSIPAACVEHGCADENLHKRYLIHVAGFNLGVLMCALYGQGTPREAAEAVSALIFVLQSDAALVFALIVAIDGDSLQSSYVDGLLARTLTG